MLGGGGLSLLCGLAHYGSQLLYNNSIIKIILFQISKALKQFTERSLVILDEFGKGTDSVCLEEFFSYDIIYCA